MADPTELPDMQARMDRLRSQSRGGDGPTGGDMEHRVSILEKAVERIDGKLDKLIDSVGELRIMSARLEEKLDHKASSSDVAELKGRVASLPTTVQLITLVVAIFVGAFAILKYGLPHVP